MFWIEDSKLFFAYNWNFLGGFIALNGLKAS
jgi:hypothetical protein